MKLFCCFTPAHQVLFDKYFTPSVPKGFSIIPNCLAIEGTGDFLSSEFIQCIWQKIDLVLETLLQNTGDVIVWSDIDIQFFDLLPEALLTQLGAADIAFQREGHNTSDVNTGFFVCRCSERTIMFFQSVRDALRQNPSTNEQHVVNELLKRTVTDLEWTYLSFAFYARTHGWPPPRKLALYHANATAGSNGVQRKIMQFRELAFLRRFGIPALILTSIKYAPKRIYRLLSNA
jgi:hypothetical protein